jgi:hypothetical protein
MRLDDDDDDDDVDAVRVAYARFYRRFFLSCAVVARVVVLAGAIVALFSEHWMLGPARGQRVGVPGLAHVGLWRACATGGRDVREDNDDGEIYAWWRDAERGFVDVGKDDWLARCGDASTYWNVAFGGPKMKSLWSVRACAIGYVGMGALELICLVFYGALPSRQRRGLGVSSKSVVTYGALTSALGGAACIAFASIVERIRRATPTQIGVHRFAYYRYIGWGFWLFLACACASILCVLYSAFDLAETTRGRGRRRRHRNATTRAAFG